MTDEELKLALTLRDLEQRGIIETIMGDDGQILYKLTGKELTDEVWDYKPARLS